MADIVMIPIENLYPHPNNPRKDLGNLSELAGSISANGVLQNLTVVPASMAQQPDFSPPDGSYVILIGHRRHAAAKAAGLTELPCVIVEMDSRDQVQTMLIENMQRSDLTVYEQAQGFQMMLDLGATVEEIAEKSGFSTTTVRRRVKMMELDQKKLQEVSSRQLSLKDFDTLAQIEDIRARNTCLGKIGTSDFDREVQWALRKQNDKKCRPIVKAWLKENNAIAIKSQDVYGNKYEGYGGGYASYIYLHDWPKKVEKIKIKPGKQIYYVMDDDSVRLYQKTEKKKPEKKSAKELAEEKAKREAWKALQDTQSVAYDLRKAFVEQLTVSGKNREKILLGAVYSGALESVEYNSADRATVYGLLGIESSAYGDKRSAQFATGIGKLRDEDLAKIVYAFYGDSVGEGCTGHTGKTSFPKYNLSIKLNLLYNWLATLGYEISTEEMAMLNGDHESYKAEATFKGEGS